MALTERERPLRKDAERNRQRILDAARELFAERGLGVTLNDIAHHAGVGVGTVYRRFPDKAELIDGLFEQRVEELAAIMEEALTDPDPWRGLTGFLERLLTLQACDRGFKDLLLGTPDGLERVARIRARMFPLGAALIQRARDAGQLRPDIEATDIPMLQLMVSVVIDCARDYDPELWRRYFAIVLQGLRADPGPPPPLDVAPLPLEGVDQVMSAWKPPRR
jgi:AcrR family transcriptional regulator